MVLSIDFGIELDLGVLTGEVTYNLIGQLSYSSDTDIDRYQSIEHFVSALILIKDNVELRCLYIAKRTFESHIKSISSQPTAQKESYCNRPTLSPPSWPPPSFFSHYVR